MPTVLRYNTPDFTAGIMRTSTNPQILCSASSSHKMDRRPEGREDCSLTFSLCAPSTWNRVSAPQRLAG